MLSFLTSKPKLASLIPANYVDIHSHILPGLDDGAETMADTQFLVEEMRKLGVTKAITTPHTMTSIWDNTPETISHALGELTAKLPLPFPIEAASEYLLDASVLAKAKNKALLPLKANFVLVELSYLNPPLALYDYLYQVQLSGYHVVLAHPERYSYFHSNKKEYQKLKEAGCLFQLNLLATVGYYGKEVAAIAAYLLKENSYDFAGTDIHHKKHILAFQRTITADNGKEITAVMEKNAFFR